MTRRRILLAAQPAALAKLKHILDDAGVVVPVHGMEEALRILAAEPDRFDLIVSTLTFSDSRMLEFLVAVKADAATSAIPFIVCRAVVGILSEKLVESLGKAAKLCGANEFVNIGVLPPDAARAALRAAVERSLCAA